MVQRHRTYNVGAGRKRNDPDAIVRPAFDELACHLADRVHARRFLTADRKIFCKHRSGNIEHQYDVDPTGLNLSKTFAKLRTRERNNENCDRRQQQRPQNFSRARRTLFSDFPKARCG